MHVQIQKLAEQAEKYADYNFKGEPFWTEAYESKFAELIVRECAEVALKTDISYIEIDAMHRIRDRIKDHFGVT
jgi:hypothetical protein